MRDYFGYANKICVVTGAASGMGNSLTRMLVDLGAEVYALDRNPCSIPGVFKEIKVDLIKKEDIDHAFLNEIPYEIDNFFGVAGISGLSNTMLETFKVNYLANKYIIEEYLFSRMIPGGAITLVTSSGGLGWELPQNKEEYMCIITPKGYDDTLKALEELCDPREGKIQVPLFYGVSKRAINYYIATVVEELANKNVRINAILPMGTDTGLRDHFAEFSGGLDNMIEYGTGAAHRMALPRDMAGPLAFLGSQLAGFCSGVLLSVDYGMLLPMLAGIDDFIFDAPGLTIL